MERKIPIDSKQLAQDIVFHPWIIDLVGDAIASDGTKGLEETIAYCIALASEVVEANTDELNRSIKSLFHDLFEIVSILPSDETK